VRARLGSLSADAELRDAVSEHLDALPQRLATMKLPAAVLGLS